MSEEQEEREVEAMATILAGAVMRRFDAMVGGPLVVSPLVFKAALDVLRKVFGPEDNVLRALDEIEELEAALRGDPT